MCRWRHATRAVKPLDRFAIRKYDGEPRIPRSHVVPRVTRAKIPESSRERYAEAMRIIQPICSELAEIDDADEFTKFCGFLLEQWRCIRLRVHPIAFTRVEPSSISQASQLDATDRGPSDGLTVSLPTDDVCVELSQANSLYSAEMGPVAVVDARSVDIDMPSELVVGSHGQCMADDTRNMDEATAVEMDGNGRCMHGTGRVMDGNRRDMDEDAHNVNEDGRHTTSFGRNVHVDVPRRTTGVEHGMDELHRERKCEEDDPMTFNRLEHKTSELHCEGKCEEDDPMTFKLKFNRKAPKHGAPVVNVKAQAAAANAVHIQYNQARAAAQARGVDSLQQLLDNLNSTQPGIDEAVNALLSVPDKHGDHKAKKPKLEMLSDPVLTTSDFFLLPKQLVLACMKKLPPDSSAARPIRVHTPTGVTPPETPVISQNQQMHVVKINQWGCSRLNKTG
jgi:hypothetical protein